MILNADNWHEIMIFIDCIHVIVIFHILYTCILLVCYLTIFIQYIDFMSY